MKKITELLISAGHTPSTAKVLTFFVLSKGAEVSSRQIERAEDLRQPEVNLAIKALVEKKWIIFIDEKPLVGRPTKWYKIQYEKVLDDLTYTKETEAKNWRELIGEIRAMMVVETVQPESSAKKEQQQTIET